MKEFGGKIAVITGGGTGMGRELARQLVAEGCSVAMCDVSEENMAETAELCRSEAAQGTKVATHVADVADEKQLVSFRQAVATQLETDHINLLFNNAGIGGGGSFVKDERDIWERTFNICWNGVYLNSRVFLPMLMKASEGYIINTSSVNGFWASLGPQTSHTAYSAAKFAVKGFTEALINDLRLNAPHIKCSLVMPGHIGTSIAINSRQVLTGHGLEDMSSEELDGMRDMIAMRGLPTDNLTDDQIRALIEEMGRSFRDDAPMTAAEAAKIILDGVREEKWRILVGEDAKMLDKLVRETPEDAYEPTFFEQMRESGWGLD